MDRRESVALFAKMSDSPVKGLLSMDLSRTIDRMNTRPKRPFTTEEELSPVYRPKRHCAAALVEVKENTPPQIRRRAPATAPVRRGLSPVCDAVGNPHWRKRHTVDEDDREPARQLHFAPARKVKKAPKEHGDYFRSLFLGVQPQQEKVQTPPSPPCSPSSSMELEHESSEECFVEPRQPSPPRKAAAVRRDAPSQSSVQAKRRGRARTGDVRKEAPATAGARKRSAGANARPASARPASRVAQLRSERCGGYTPTPVPEKAVRARGRTPASTRPRKNMSELKKAQLTPSVFSYRYSRGAMPRPSGAVEAPQGRAEVQEAQLIDKVFDAMDE